MAGPIYALSAAPVDTAHFEHFFDSGAGTIMDMLEHPKSFRYAGWDLETLDRAHIMNGECLEVSNGDRKIIRLYEDGTFLLKASANSDFLGWGRYQDEFDKAPRLNPLAIIEITTAVVHFYQALLKRFEEPPTEIKFKTEFHNAEINGNRLYLIPGAFKSVKWLFDDKSNMISAPDVEKEVNIKANELAEDPNFVAYKLVQLVYLFFSIPSNQIPYVIDDGKKRRIDPGSFSEK